MTHRRRTALLAFLGSVLACGATAGVRVLLIERPEKLMVFNQYQQAATTEELKRLAPFAPVIVVRPQEMLPDGYTSSMVVRAEGETFFFVRDASGGLAGAAEAGRIRSIEGAELLGDTVQAAAGVTVEPESGGVHRAARGSLLQRLFRSGGSIYVRLLSPKGSLGWIHGASEAGLRSYHAPGSQVRGDRSTVESMVRLKIDETNTVLRRLFGLFNRRAGRNLSPPLWRLTPERGALVCEFSGGSPHSTFDGSAGFLAKDIENSLIGTGCRVETVPGLITVRLP